MIKKLIVFLSLFTTLSTYAQVDRKSELYKVILYRDSLLFNVGFNTCDIAQFENIVSNSFEFYHDKAGITSSKVEFIKSIKDGLCKLSYKPRRKLVEKSMEVFPLEKQGHLYGAIQTGTHQFFAIEKDKPEYITSIANFTHLWLLEDGSWKLSKGLSYNHRERELTDEINESLLFNDKNETEKWIAQNKVPILGIGFIEKGQLQEISLYGHTEKGKPASDNTIFNVASLTKPVTAIIALKLISLGKWSLDEPLYKYWTDPDIANDHRNKKITTRQILSHQAGFPNWRYDTENKKLIFLSDPGTKFEYSGEGLEYLRKALEKKFNKNLQQLADELIFKPLKLTDTKYVWESSIDSSRLAIGYDKNGNTYDIVKSRTPNAADDLMTTIKDYGNFLISVMNEDGLSEKVFNEMTKHQIASNRGKHFGLGFEIYDFDNGEFALSHGGADKGVRTIMFIFPKTKKGLIIFTNSDTGGNLYEIIVKHYLGEIGQKIIDIETK